MTTESHAPVTDSRLSRVANNLVIGLARHWLALFNSAWAVYVLTPFLAPVLMELGLDGPARAIYFFYSFLCHQLPDHSYFLFGPSLVPQDAALIAGGMSDSTSLFVQRAFVGSEAVGWKVALCERDVAIYLGVLASGLLFAALGKRPRPLSFKLFVLLATPMAIDGLTQLFGWRESSWLLRTITGLLFGFAAVWLAYPYVEDGMRDVLEDELRRQRTAAGRQPSET
ncbi:MAG: DUF2085 domain-containing protein [Caldilineaceae bacterium]|nr:DUF2085 domain-containing protein [Caldilineaceae bacterium]